MWYIHIGEYYSAIKKEILLFVTTWMNLEGFMLSEISQSEKDMYDLTYMWKLKTFVDGWDFPGGPVVDCMLPMQGAWVRSLVGELRSHMPCGMATR